MQLWETIKFFHRNIPFMTSCMQHYANGKPSNQKTIKAFITNQPILTVERNYRKSKKKNDMNTEFPFLEKIFKTKSNYFQLSK